MNITFSRRLAIIIGIILPIAETFRRWGTGGFLPWWLDDYLIATFLLYAAWRNRKGAANDPRYLSAAWAFACGIGYMSFFGHLENIEQPDPASIPHVWVTGIIGVGWLLTILGLATSLRAHAQKEHMPNYTFNPDAQKRRAG